MKTVVIAGASGVVGARALTHLLARGDVGRVVALGRRVLDAKHDKLASKVVDLQSPSSMAAEIPDDVAAAICCLGTTMKQAGSKEAFQAVDRDAVVAFAKAARQKGASRFVLVSSVGADSKAMSLYMKTKGEAEDAIREMGYAQVTFLRPSLLDDQGARSDHRIGEKLSLPLARAVFAVVGKTNRYAPITADTVARAAVSAAFDDTGEPVRALEGADLHRLGAG